MRIGEWKVENGNRNTIGHRVPFPLSIFPFPLSPLQSLISRL